MSQTVRGLVQCQANMMTMHKDWLLVGKLLWQGKPGVHMLVDSTHLTIFVTLSVDRVVMKVANCTDVWCFGVHTLSTLCNLLTSSLKIKLSWKIRIFVVASEFSLGASSPQSTL